MVFTAKRPCTIYCRPRFPIKQHFFLGSIPLIKSGLVGFLVSVSTRSGHLLLLAWWRAGFAFSVAAGLRAFLARLLAEGLCAAQLVGLLEQGGNLLVFWLRLELERKR